MKVVHQKFFEFKVRTVRREADNPDRQIVDFEKCMVNLDHVLSLAIGPEEGTSVLAFPNGTKLLAKGAYDDLLVALKDPVVTPHRETPVSPVETSI